MITPLGSLRKIKLIFFYFSKNTFLRTITFDESLLFLTKFCLLDKENPKLFIAHFQAHLKEPHSSLVVRLFYNLLKILYKRTQK